MANFMLKSCVVLGALSAVAGLRGPHQAQAEAQHGKKTHRPSLLAQTAQAEQALVICNAYASPKSLEIMAVRTRVSLTEGSPLAYKQCKEFSLPLEEGDQIDFKAGGLDVGTFYATGLPKSASSLLLIPHRRSPHAVGVSFESHAFAQLQSPQIAVIDAYRGKSQKKIGTVKIIENLPPSTDKAELTEVEEELRFNSVVAVNPGKYSISIPGGGDNRTHAALNAVGAGKYVIMRLGNEDEVAGGHYPQELIVFPNSALRTATSFGVCLLMAVAALFGSRRTL